MKKPIIVIGMGELGSVFARGFLKLSYPVQAVTRQQSADEMAKEIPEPTAVLVAVGEADIAAVLASVPAVWKQNLILLQNELLPRDWMTANINDPTVISVWFEKKKGMDSKVVIPSPVYGKHSKLIFDALSTLDLPCTILDSEEELNYELVRKNLYILTTNIAGLEVGGSVQTLQKQHKSVMDAVANDVLDIQDWLTEQKNDRNRLMGGLLDAFDGDPEHGCMGRSAPARLTRALGFAKQAGINAAKLNEIASKHLS